METRGVAGGATGLQDGTHHGTTRIFRREVASPCFRKNRGIVYYGMMRQQIEQYLVRISTYPWWVVVIELLLIGVVVHAVIEFLRGTRGARLIKGTALFLVVTYIIIRLGGDKLVRLEYLYSRLLVFATFAIVVVFQPELRRALIRLGEARLFRPMSNPVRQTVDVVSRCAAY